MDLSGVHSGSDPFSPDLGLAAWLRMTCHQRVSLQSYSSRPQTTRPEGALFLPSVAGGATGSLLFLDGRPAGPHGEQGRAPRLRALGFGYEAALHTWLTGPPDHRHPWERRDEHLGVAPSWELVPLLPAPVTRPFSFRGVWGLTELLGLLNDHGAQARGNSPCGLWPSTAASTQVQRVPWCLPGSLAGGRGAGRRTLFGYAQAPSPVCGRQGLYH